MFSLKLLPEFSDWLHSQSDRMTRLRLSRRLDKAQRGNLGDVRSVCLGVFEMREHFGPGWRMYYTLRGETLIVMLAGGDKSTQSADISRAQRLLAEFEE